MRRRKFSREFKVKAGRLVRSLESLPLINHKKFEYRASLIRFPADRRVIRGDWLWCGARRAGSTNRRCGQLNNRGSC
jgi:hypothetical protein